MQFDSTDGVLLVAHGTVGELEDLPSFLLEIRRGRTPSLELVEQMRQRYEAIGGSPFLRETLEQGAALARALGVPVLGGMRFGSPRLAEALQGAASLGLRRLFVLPMAPYSVGLYAADAQRAKEALASEERIRHLELVPVRPWGTHPRLVAAHLEQIRSHAARALTDSAELFLTAHSLPLAVIRAGDDYAQQTAQACERIGEGLGYPTQLVYQSQGADGGEWLGPSVAQALQRSAERGAREVIVCPFGFLCEHVETLYDLDIEAAAQARALGLQMTRVPALGTAARAIAAMAEVVREALVSSSEQVREGPLS